MSFVGSPEEYLVSTDRLHKRRRNEAMNRLLKIGGEVVTMSEVCSRSGLTMRQIFSKYSARKREWADYGL